MPCPPDAEDFEPRTKGLLRRYGVERCLYGVDLDPLAVELCRLALWIETMDRDLPFSFLDHKVKCGNSLVGAWFDQFAHYPAMAWKNRDGGDKGHSNGVHFEKDVRTKALKAFVKERLQPDFLQWFSLQLKLDEPLYENPGQVHDQALATLARLHELPIQDAAEHARRYREEFLGSPAWQSLKRAFDLWCSCWFWPADELDDAPLPSSFAHPAEATRVIAARVAAQKRFFHWELEFPDVFRLERSGFDAVLGNPPWETLQPNSMEFFSNTDPLYRSYGKQDALRKQTDYFMDESMEQDWIEYNADFNDDSNWMKFAANPFGDPKHAEKSTDRFALARGHQNEELHSLWRRARVQSKGYAYPEHPFCFRGEGKAYTYKLFLEQAHALLKETGRLGFIVPSGLYSDYGTGDLRELFLEQCRWEWLFGFENREKVFDIDSRFKFNPVIVEKGGKTAAIRTAFMRRRLEDWEKAEEHVTLYTRERVEQFSPRSKAILEIQSARDLEILEKIYANSVLLGDDGPEGWGITYAQGDFNMTSDSKLFPPRPQWEAQGYRPDEYSRWLKGKWRPVADLWKRLGMPSSDPGMRRCAQPPYDTLPLPRADIPVGIVLSRDATEWIEEEEVEDVALPLYEGRMIGQFDFSQKGWISGRGRGAVWREIPYENKVVEPQFLMSESVFEQQCPEEAGIRALVMDVTSATNTRTVISAFGARCPCGHKTPTLTPRQPAILSVLACVSLLNSYVFDFITRARLGGNSLVWSVIEAAGIPLLIFRHEEILARYIGSLCLISPAFACNCLKLHWLRQEKAIGLTALTSNERLRVRAGVDAIMAACYGLEEAHFIHVLEDCDWPVSLLRSGSTLPRNPKGFWRVDKDKPPELRHTVLTLVAFHDLQQKIAACSGDRDKGIEAFCSQNDGEGWMLPETLRLADYGLGHDERAKEPQPVASRLGPRFFDWQLAQDPEESWRECELHARNLLGEEGYQKLLAEIEAEKRGEKPPAERLRETAPPPKATKKKPKKKEVPEQIKLPFDRASTGTAESTRPAPVEAWEIHEVMALFRQVARRRGAMTRHELVKEVSLAMGFQRLSQQQEEALRNHLRAAVRRRIIGTQGDDVWLQTPTMADYSRDEIVNTIYSVTRKDQLCEVEDLVRTVAEYLGFQRLREEVAEPVRKAIRYMIREGALSREGTPVRRLLYLNLNMVRNR